MTRTHGRTHRQPYSRIRICIRPTNINPDAQEGRAPSGGISICVSFFYVSICIRLRNICIKQKNICIKQKNICVTLDAQEGRAPSGGICFCMSICVSICVIICITLYQYLYQINKSTSINPDDQEGRAPSGGGRKMAAEKKEDSADEK